MNRRLHFGAISTFANPDDAVSRLLSGVQNPNHIARAEFRIQSRQQCTTQADVAGVGLLQESIAFSVDTPDREREMDLDAWFTAAVGAKISHILLTVAPGSSAVKVRSEAWQTKARESVPFQERSRNGR